KSLLRKKPLKVHVKIDTGMGRLGIKYTEALKFISKLSRNKNFIIDGVYTHFATSDEKEKTFATLQLERFKNIIEELEAAGINFGLAHAANSGAILDMPEAYFDMVRPGISLYGYYPSLETSESIKLKPVMNIISLVNSIKRILPGESVSYSRRFTAIKETTILETPFGYADGYHRNLTNKIYCIIKDKLYPQVGTVTMDRIMFDVGNDKIKIGDKIILLGKSKKQVIDAWDWGKALGTIPYEITCGITKRVPRIPKN
ncbi:MAG: alanine racemase, partial [Ignavibacteriaceae bacterium]|nr:alanine racemase [Ignavibacteriaceae bacterium]